MNVLIYGNIETSPALRHELPLAIGDPFLYLEADGGRRAVVTSALEEVRIAQAAPDIERLLGEELGRDELMIDTAAVPPDFPLALADRLRASGVELNPDEELFAQRRRRKTEVEVAGVRRAAGAAIQAMREVAGMLREAQVRDDQLYSGDGPLTSEAVRSRIREVCARVGSPAPPDIMVKPMGPDPRIGHYPGSGPLPAHSPILVDLWPRDEESGCWADMTRTFVRGQISDQIAEIHELVMTAHERACAAARPGVSG